MATGRLLLLAMLLVSTPLVGCLGGAEETDDTTERRDEASTDGTPGPASLAAGAQGCYESVALFPRDPATLTPHLPDGFQPRDATALFGIGLDAPSGRGIAFVNGFTCQRTDLEDGPGSQGETAILVQPPDLGEHTPETASTIDFYLLEVLASGAATVQQLSELGVPARQVGFQVDHTAVGPLYQGGVIAEQAGELVFSFTHEAAPADPYTGLVRLWHLTPAGIAYFEYSFEDFPTAKGQVTACEIGQDGPAHAVLGVTDCQDETPLALLFLEQTWEGTLHVLPGVLPR